MTAETKMLLKYGYSQAIQAAVVQYESGKFNYAKFKKSIDDLMKEIDKLENKETLEII